MAASKPAFFFLPAAMAAASAPEAETDGAAVIGPDITATFFPLSESRFSRSRSARISAAVW